MIQELASRIPPIIIRLQGMGIIPPKMGVQPTDQRPRRIRMGEAVVAAVAAAARALMLYLEATTVTARTVITTAAWAVTHRRHILLAHVEPLRLWAWRTYPLPKPFKIHWARYGNIHNTTLLILSARCSERSSS